MLGQGQIYYNCAFAIEMMMRLQPVLTEIDSRTPTTSGIPLNSKVEWILFFLREKAAANNWSLCQSEDIDITGSKVMNPDRCSDRSSKVNICYTF